MDMPVPYCPSLEGHKQIFRGDYRKLDFLCDESMTTVFCSHGLEDWLTPEQIIIVNEWKRVLECGGNLVIVCPVEKVYRKHCDETGQCYNQNHRCNSSLEQFKRDVLPHTGSWEILYENPLVDVYSWNIALRKLR